MQLDALDNCGHAQPGAQLENLARLQHQLSELAAGEHERRAGLARWRPLHVRPGRRQAVGGAAEAGQRLGDNHLVIVHKAPTWSRPKRLGRPEGGS